MKYRTILSILPLIGILSVREVKCECIDLTNLTSTIIHCTGVTINRDTTLKNLIQPSPAGTSKLDIIISDSNVPAVYNDIFASIDSVEKLHLINDNITYIFPFSFHTMTELKELIITNNKLTKIETETFIGINSLNILNLSYNNLTSMEYIYGLMNLKELNVNNNNLLKLNEGSFRGMTQLEVLDLCYNKLTSLEYINQIYSLEVLNISYNLIESVTGYDFQKLKSLKSLDLSQNMLTSLSPKLFVNSHNLTELFLKNNSIKHFSNDLFNRSISHVDLSLNLMEFVQCEQFQGTVVLPNNFIDTVCHFGDNVTSINFSECDLPSVEKGSFKHLTKLTFLNLTKNFIKTVDVDAFENLYNLITLTINDNEISTLEVGTFHQLVSLEELDISLNFIESLNHGIFTGLSELLSLNLGHNQLKIIDNYIFYPLKSLNELNLEGNPLITFDTSDLTGHLTSLRSLSINFEEMGCENLRRKLYNLHRDNVQVEQGEHLHGPNVDGIACIPNSDNLSENESIALRVINSFRTFRTIFVLITVAFAILVVMHFVSWYRKHFDGGKGKINIIKDMEPLDP